MIALTVYGGERDLGIRSAKIRWGSERRKREGRRWILLSLGRWTKEKKKSKVVFLATEGQLRRERRHSTLFSEGNEGEKERKNWTPSWRLLPSGRKR